MIGNQVTFLIFPYQISRQQFDKKAFEKYNNK